MKKYIIEYNNYNDILALLGHDIPHSNLVNVKHVIVNLTDEEYEGLVGAGITIRENYIPDPEKALLSIPADIPFRTRPLITGGVNDVFHITRSKAAGFDGTGVKVALLDTGCQPANAALANPSLILMDFTGFGTDDPFYGHGSKGCMIISQRHSNATTDNAQHGSAYGCQLYSMNVLLGGSAALIEAIDFCISEGIHIINISLDMGSGLDAAITAAIAAGIIVVVASGNDPVTPVTHPANVPGVIAIGSADTLTPGMPVQSSHITSDGHIQIACINYNAGHYEFFAGGSSQAAWQTSAMLAIWKQKYPSLNTPKAINLLRRGARQMTGYTYATASNLKEKLLNYETGGGLIPAIN